MRNILFSNTSLVLLCFIFIITTQACAVYNSSVSSDSLLWGGYSQDKNYITQRDLFLIDHDVSGEYLIPEKNIKRRLGRFNLAPDSINEYKNKPQAASVYKLKNGSLKLNVIGIVEKGTKLKVHKVAMKKSWMIAFGSSEKLMVYGEIVSGPYSGKVVDIRDLSIYYNQPTIGRTVYKPEPGVLAPVND